MLTGTDESISLEEWNVDTIAHLEAENLRVFLPCGIRRLQQIALMFYYLFVLTYSKKN